MEKRTDSLKARVARYFVRIDPNDENNKLYQCQIEKCKRKCNGSQPSNLTVHVKLAHKEFFAKKIMGAIDPKEFAIKRLKFIQNCAEVIAINGRAFKSLSDSGIRKLIAEKLNELKSAGYGKGLRAPAYTAVKQHIQYQAARIDEEIKKEVRGRFIALMVDTASRNNKTFMGLSLQYVLDGRVIIRCIGMSEIDDAHSSLNIKNIIMHRLNFFDINIKQVISITTDNAPNMIAMLKRFNTVVDEEENREDEESGEDEESDGEEENDGNKHENEDSETDYDEHEFMDLHLEHQAELDEMLDDNREYVALVENCVNDLAKKTMIINGIRCAAHTLQLAVRDTLQESLYGSAIDRFRDICKFLRKPSSIRILKEQNIKIYLPRIDCSTRWSSLYRMVCICLQFIDKTFFTRNMSLLYI